jgi:hypothetical protein
MPAVQTQSSSINIPRPMARRFFGLISGRAWSVILIGLGIRIWVGLHSVIINPDGALYIHQAMAMYYKNWNSLKTCTLPFISAYPFLIAGGYYVIHDWILSARLISLVFGMAMLIPLYLIVKEWVREDCAILTLSVFAVTPVLVSNSVELVRDPICWFFLSAGTFAVIHQTTRRSPWRLLIASICFLTAAWARIEAILYLPITLGYLSYDRKNTKATDILFFLSPLLAILFFSIAGLMFSGLAFSDLHRGKEIAGKFIEPIRQYLLLADSLKSMVWSSPNLSMEFFLPEVRNLIWLIALGTVLNRFLEAFFYPFVVFYILGFSGIRRHRSDARLHYLLVLSAVGLALLYLHTLQTWMLYYRFFGIVMIPAAVFCAFGMERLLDILPRKLMVQSSTVFWLIFLLIIGVSLPKNLKSSDSDKSVFVHIGETIFRNCPDASDIRIASSRHTQIWISFYANFHLPKTPPCPLDPANCWESYPDDPEQFKNRLRQNKQKFVLWEEKHWPFHNFGLSDSPVSHTYQELGRWYHRDTGNMILYAVRETDD